MNKIKTAFKILFLGGIVLVLMMGHQLSKAFHFAKDAKADAPPPPPPPPPETPPPPPPPPPGDDS